MRAAIGTAHDVPDGAVVQKWRQCLTVVHVAGDGVFYD
jgi:hypothetical protein